MNIEQSSNRLVVRHNPMIAWVFYSIFVLGGLAIVALNWDRVLQDSASTLGMALGIANVLGGFYLMALKPASDVELDTDCGEIRVRRWSPLWSHSHWYSMAALDAVELERLELAGRPNRYRAVLCFSSSERVPVTQGWSSHRRGSEAVVWQIQSFVSAIRTRNSRVKV